MNAGNPDGVPAASVPDTLGSAADIVIEPDVSTVEITDFKNADKIAKLGRAAAEEALPELKQVLHEMDAALFPL